MHKIVELVFLAFVAFLIIRKLFAILGEVDRDNVAERVSQRKQYEDSKEMKDVIPKAQSVLEGATSRESDMSVEEARISPSLRNVIDNIRKVEHSFNVENFLHSVEKVYYIIQKSITSDSIDELEVLMEYDGYAKLKNVMLKNKERGYKVVKNVISVRDVDIVDAVISENNQSATISVEIQSEEIDYTVSSNDVIISGYKGTTSKIVMWKFSKVIGNGSVIWLLKEHELHL
ncbi:Tim44 domain-containing protein [Candidatus Fokinia crypta]|uniref:Tim44-like domain protein n=1 Tax=Candidatus Fokinia crypta TaxID=1920990 RepID=A0ABZ0USF0_9RICK|nr:Tim44/TimA family putative adaptor protein [Candidatus Fokinia cryptica]WPX97830.1 Tim44-like domain protein [Candidatus Fokinia cryptica]